MTKYNLSPEVVDLIAFCTKNPLPMLPFLDALKPYGQYWFVTITPYGRDIEPNVPDKETVMEGFKKLSDVVGVDSIGWRYDPIFIDKKHSVEWHISEFERRSQSDCVHEQVAERIANVRFTKWLKFLPDTQRHV